MAFLLPYPIKKMYFMSLCHTEKAYKKKLAIWKQNEGKTHLTVKF